MNTLSAEDKAAISKAATHDCSTVPNKCECPTFARGAEWGIQYARSQAAPDSGEIEKLKARIAELEQAVFDRDKLISNLIKSDLCGEIYDGGSVVGTKELEALKSLLKAYGQIN